jgi:hypothetical protein
LVVSSFKRKTALKRAQLVSEVLAAHVRLVVKQGVTQPVVCMARFWTAQVGEAANETRLPCSFVDELR